jgi:hypothetical protein
MKGFKYTPVYDPREYKYINIGDSEFYNTENLKQDKSADYYEEAAHASSSLAFKNWAMNRGFYNQPLYDALEVIKEKNPAAYYTEQIKLLGRQAGWLYGQNDPTSANTYVENAKNIAPDALKAGISGDQISSLFNQNVALSSEQNQRVIAGEAESQRSFGLEGTIRGLLPIAALAIGGPLLDAALTAGTAASAAGGTAAGTGLTGGAGGSTGLLGGTGAAGFGGAGSASGIAGAQAAAGLGVASGSALPAAGMAVGSLPSTVGSLSAALPAQGSVGGAGLLSAELAPGTILGSGLPGGGAIGASYALGANGLPATNLLGQPIAASSIGFGDIPATVTSGLNISIKDALDAARLGRGILGGGAAQPAQTGQAAPRPQSIMPRGQVDYSGILNLLQARSPQRNPNSLLG